VRTGMILSLLLLAQTTWGASASGQTSQAWARQPLVLIPTAFEELNELRVNTGEKAVLNDGTMNAVYVKKLPSQGNIYLNFHVDVASETGPFVLHAKEIRLEGAWSRAVRGDVAVMQGKTASQRRDPQTYTPMDWFLDTGSAEVRGDALTVDNKAIVQFTIEVPRAGLDDLTLFVRSQRIGTVREIRAQIAHDRGLPGVGSDAGRPRTGA